MSDEKIVRKQLKLMQKALDGGDIEGAYSVMKGQFDHDKSAPMAVLVEDFVRNSGGWFRTGDMYSTFELGEGKERDTNRRGAYQKLMRMVKNGDVEHRDSRYRRVDKLAKEIEWWDAPDKEVPIKLQFDIHKYIMVFPMNMIIHAGVSDAGKSGLMFRTIQDNMDNRELWEFYEKEYQKEVLFEILDSDSGSSQLKSRINNIADADVELWKKCVRVRERNEDFAPVIVPSAINFVDNFKQYDNFYLIAKEFDKVQERFRGHKGICFCAIQKNKGADFGTGGHWSMHNAALYISVDYGEITIKKAKNRRTENILDWKAKFELEGGNVFKLTQRLQPDIIDDNYRRVKV